MINQMNNGFQQPGMMANALPVRPDVPMAPFVPGTPDYPSTYPSNINICPQLMQHNRLIVGTVMHELQMNCNKNALRVFCYNLFSAGNWMNKDFHDLVVTTADYALYLIVRQNYDTRNAIGTAANAVCSWITALIAQRYSQHGLNQYISQDMLPDLQNLMNSFQVAMGQVNEMKQQLAWQQQQQQQQHFNQPQVAQFAGHNNPAMNSPALGVNPNQVPGGFNGMFSGGAPAAPANSDLGSLAMMPSMGGTYIKDEPVVSEVTFAPNRAPEIAVENLGHQPSMADNAVNNALVFNGLKLASRHQHITRNWSIDRPYALAYNPKTHAMFIDVDASQARGLEVIKNIEEVGVEYIDHELDCNFKLKAYNEMLSPRRTVVPKWNSLVETKNTADLEKDTSRDITIQVKQTVVVDKKIVANTLQQAIHLARSYLNKNNIKVAKNTPVEFAYRKVTPFYVDDSYGNIINEAKESLSSIDDFTEAYSALDILIDHLPVDVWTYLDKRLTDAVNKELSIGLGIRTSIDSFHADIYALLTSLEKRGEGVRNALCKNQKTIIKNALRNVKNEPLKEYLTSVGETVTEDYEARHIVFFEDCLVVLVPWLSSKIDVVFREQAGAVMESMFPDFHAALKAVVEKSKEMKTSKIEIITPDNVIIEVSDPTLGDNIFMVSRGQ